MWTALNHRHQDVSLDFLLRNEFQFEVVLPSYKCVCVCACMRACMSVHTCVCACVHVLGENYNDLPEILLVTGWSLTE